VNDSHDFGGLRRARRRRRGGSLRQLLVLVMARGRRDVGRPRTIDRPDWVSRVCSPVRETFGGILRYRLRELQRSSGKVEGPYGNQVRSVHVRANPEQQATASETGEAAEAR
jgi:hypothetical protein